MAAPATDEALRRFRLIRPFLNDSIPLPAIARTSGIPLRTLYHWTENYRRQGLAREPRTDKSKLRSLPPTSKPLIEALALEKPRCSVAAICRTIGALAANGPGKAPGYITAARIRPGRPPVRRVPGLSTQRLWRPILPDRQSRASSLSHACPFRAGKQAVPTCERPFIR